MEKVQCPHCGLEYKWPGQAWKHQNCKPTLPPEKQKLLEQITQEIENRTVSSKVVLPNNYPVTVTKDLMQETVPKKFDRSEVMRQRWAKRKAEGNRKL